jgi:5-oxoprolinase (ATP-hydrolysing)
MTDPEVLELRYPVRVETFAIRRGSGGAGLWRGGDGAIRRIRFLAPMKAVLVSGSRVVAPFGLAGGEDGAPGAQWIDRADGTTTPLSGRAAADMLPGDAITILTPGGGGFGVSWAKAHPLQAARLSLEVLECKKRDGYNSAWASLP